jgi:uncharacterized protein (UPF0297 family)
MAKHHITASITEDTYQAFEQYRDANKEMQKPEISQIVEEALLMYLKSKSKPKTI